MADDIAENIIRYPWDTAPKGTDVIEVADGILWARLPLPMALDHVNVYFLKEPGGWTMVDTGFDTKKTRALLTKIIEGPLGGEPIIRVLATHHHPDHIGLAGWLIEQGAHLVTTRTAWLSARMLTLDDQALPPKETLAFWKANGMDPDILAKRAEERPFNFADCVAPLPAGYHRIKDGDRITLGQRVWNVRVGHGHAPEHAVLYEVDGNLVIGGDQLLPSISPNIGVYPTEPDADPIGEWLSSCETLTAYARPDHLVLPGHKLPYIGLPMRMRQLADNHYSALDRLLDHIKTPRRGGECFEPLFKRRVNEAIYGLAFVESIAHLNHLWHTGRATRTLGQDGVYLWQAKDRS